MSQSLPAILLRSGVYRREISRLCHRMQSILVVETFTEKFLS